MCTEERGFEESFSCRGTVTRSSAKRNTGYILPTFQQQNRFQRNYNLSILYIIYSFLLKSTDLVMVKIKVKFEMGSGLF